MGTEQPPEARHLPLRRQALHLLRRGHLYLGLFLFPWAVLYGVTAFLFNHPSAFPDQPTAIYGPAATAGTPLDGASGPTAVAEQVVARLNEEQKPATPYRLAGEAKYGREFAFATVKAGGETVSVLYDVRHGGGTVRVTPTVEKATPERAPFATGGGRSPSPRERGGPPSPGVKLPEPLHERFKAAVPAILERTGFPSGEVTVTSVPDVVFPVEADGRTWIATYNPMSGAITGAPADATPPTEVSWRRFLLRLHTAHGYPGAPTARWYWAVVVDVSAAALCFWGVSGLVMWWQLKATRTPGLVVLLLSTVAAATLGVIAHVAMTA
jgi:hypothetical protein